MNRDEQKTSYLPFLLGLIKLFRHFKKIVMDLLNKTEIRCQNVENYNW